MLNRSCHLSKILIFSFFELPFNSQLSKPLLGPTHTKNQNKKNVTYFYKSNTFLNLQYRVLSSKRAYCNWCKFFYQVISWDEVKSHAENKEKWLVVDGQVYNITSWARKHPGGSRVITHYAGQDATVSWRKAIQVASSNSITEPEQSIWPDPET